MGHVQQRPGAGEEGFAGIFGPGLGDGDGKDHHDGDGEEDGPAEDGEGVGFAVAVKVNEVGAGGHDADDVADEAENGGGEGEVEAGTEDGFHIAGAVADDEGLFEFDAGEGAEGVGEGGEEEGGEGGDEEDPEGGGEWSWGPPGFSIFDFRFSIHGERFAFWVLRFGFFVDGADADGREELVFAGVHAAGLGGGGSS